MKQTIFDHVAIGTRNLTDGWQLFGGLLGGTWVYGGDSPGYWWGQVRFAAGPKIELLTPTAGPDGAFLERFLTSRGPGPHHFTFLVADLSQTLDEARALGIEPVGVDLSLDGWKEAFLHPRDAHGIVIQLAQQSFSPELAPPAELPEPGPPSAFEQVEHHVADLPGATKLFTELLHGDLVSPEGPQAGSVAELAWPDGARLRLVGPPAEAAETLSAEPLSAEPLTAEPLTAEPSSAGAARTHLHFKRLDAGFSAAERAYAEDLAKRLGTSLHLHST
jgi:methylmalonyl-CoA/ethylmalonyl-CoA epimerase